MAALSSDDTGVEGLAEPEEPPPPPLPPPMMLAEDMAAEADEPEGPPPLPAAADARGATADGRLPGGGSESGRLGMCGSGRLWSRASGKTKQISTHLSDDTQTKGSLNKIFNCQRKETLSTLS